MPGSNVDKDFPPRVDPEDDLRRACARFTGEHRRALLQLAEARRRLAPFLAWKTRRGANADIVTFAHGHWVKKLPLARGWYWYRSTVKSRPTLAFCTPRRVRLYGGSDGSRIYRTRDFWMLRGEFWDIRIEEPETRG